MARRPMVVAVAAASVACGIAFAAFVIGLVARLAGGAEVPIGGVAALVAALVMVFVAWRASSPAHTNATAIALAFAVVPVLAAGSHWALVQPLATTHVRCGTGDIGIPLAAVLILFVSSTIALPFAWLVATHLRTRVAFVAGGALTIALGVSTFAALRSLQHPEPDSYLQAFDRMSLAPGGTLTAGDVQLAYDATPTPAPLMGDRTCMLHVSHDGFENDPLRIFAVDACPHLAVYRHARSGVVVVGDASHPSHVDGIIRHGLGGEPDIDIDTLRGTLGAPRGWVVGGAVGFSLAFAALAFAFLDLRRARMLPPIIAAAHEGGGWVRIDDVPRFVPALMATSPGAVAIIAPASRTATYRNDGAAAEYEVAPETADALRARAVSWAWTAAAIATCSAVPLWVARSFGLL